LRNITNKEMSAGGSVVSRQSLVVSRQLLPASRAGGGLLVPTGTPPLQHGPTPAAMMSSLLPCMKIFARHLHLIPVFPVIPVILVNT
jgi:hypothetical protein